MCGISGIASIMPIIDQAWLSNGRDTMIHRGPDDFGEWWSTNGQVGLAFRRLAILDLTAKGHQPMSDVDMELTIVFNGEIYNFSELRTELKALGAKFYTTSDTEVILYAYKQWGTDCISRFNGMFSFALYDNRIQKLFMARDRAGEKPFFYHLKNGTIHFASELKALMAEPSFSRRINSESLDCYLAMGFIPGERCILRDFNKLPPAHAMQFDLLNGDINIWQYWQLPETDTDLKHGKKNEANLLKELEYLLEDSVRRQMVADVPVGVLLSGGVDSSLITAMAVRSSNNVKTFTIRFPGHGKLDETEHARMIAKHFNTEHVELNAGPTNVDILPLLAHQFDEPMVDSSMIPTFLVSKLVRQHCTVALGGDGGDELFGGYPGYSRLLWMQRRLGIFPMSLRQAISSSAGYFLPVGFKGRDLLTGLGIDIKSGLPLNTIFFDRKSRLRLMRDFKSWNTPSDTIFKERIPDNPDILQRATRMDFSDYLAEDILVKVDRASMLNSLEMRAPFLDYRIVEFAFRKVPSYLKVNAGDKKILLKKLTTLVLPKEFDRQRKQGFSIPLSEWLKFGAFRDLFHDVLMDSQSIFNKHAVVNLLRGQDQGLGNSERLFGLVIFELWRREYKATL
jgi:asparagine synthase (glutamine-hydrolysing)